MTPIGPKVKLRDRLRRWDIFLDNLGHTLKLPHRIQHPICEWLDRRLGA